MTSPKHPHSVHLGGGLIEQDFRGGSAQSTAAPSAVEPSDDDWAAFGEWSERDRRAALMRERTEGYVYARQQAADFVRSAGRPDLASSILLNWAPGFLPPVCASCEGSGDREVFVQSGGSMPWNAGDGHDETVRCPDCGGEGIDYGATGSPLREGTRPDAKDGAA